MRAQFRRALPILALLLLLTPVAVFAQTETAAQLIELVFSEDESSVQIEETIQSAARVTFTHDGQTYVMKVPVTIDVDSTIPLADSTLTVDAASRVGVFAIEILTVTEPDKVEEGGLFGTTVEPSKDTNKLIAVSFRLTNLVDESREFQGSLFGDEKLVGIDDLGREFEVEEILGCDSVSPGGYEDCIAVFDVDSQVSITSLEFHVMDKRSVPLPEVEEAEEDSEEEEE